MASSGWAMCHWTSNLVIQGMLPGLALGAVAPRTLGFDLGPAPPKWLAAAGDEPLGPDQLAFKWLGTAGFEIRTAEATVLFDPFFSRYSLWRILSGPIAADPALYGPHVHKADAIFIGHAHYDHMLDAPALAKTLGATLYASEDALRVAKAEGVEGNAIKGGETFTLGDLEIEVVRGVHAQILSQLLVGGAMPLAVSVPMRFSDYKNGPVFGFFIHWRGRTIFHSGSCDLIDENLAGRAVDVFLVCLSGWKSTRDPFGRFQRAITPAVVVPMHHDDFFRPLSEGFIEGRVAHVEEARATIRREMPEAAILSLTRFFQEYRLT